jgi:hypothetical protein
MVDDPILGAVVILGLVTLLLWLFDDKDVGGGR